MPLFCKVLYKASPPLTPTATQRWRQSCGEQIRLQCLTQERQFCDYCLNDLSVI